MKKNFPVWQITVPLGTVLMFTLGIGAFIVVKLTHGSYTVEFDASPQQVRFRTDIDKEERESTGEIVEPTTLNDKNFLEAKP